MTKSTHLPLFSNVLNSLLQLLLVYLQFPHAAIAFHPTNETDLFALLALKDHISEDPLGVMGSWNESLHFCKWRGVLCSSRHEGRVTVLNLAGQKLVGSLSPHIGNMSFMRQINLSSNNFNGEIPQEVGRLFRLRSLDLSYNTFQGNIPANLSSCSNLQYLNFILNELTGEIPNELGHLQNTLRLLALSGNHLTGGGIPQWLGNASSLEQLSLALNNLHGSIPNELGRLANLRFFQLGQNDLSGDVPLSIFNLSSIQLLSVAVNRLQGRLPPDIFFTLPNLRRLLVGNNSFYGEVPPSLVNATKLETLDLGDKNFTGAVPSNLASLKNLVHFSLPENQLETAIGEGLGFITSLTNCSNLETLQLIDNHFEGELPASIANFSSKLQGLMIGGSQISGKIPDQIGNLVGLRRLVLRRMDISGEIPSSMGRLNSLYVLSLSENKISGSIPSSLGKLTALSAMSLSGNSLSGMIPPSLGNYSQLQYLYLSSNNLTGNLPKQLFRLSGVLELSFEMNTLTGQLPLEIENMTNLIALSVSNNQFSGKIPSNLGNCLMLEQLGMNGNLFKGEIPPLFSSLKSLQFIDLSRNNMSGQVPKYLQNFTLLNYLNLSFNNFEGELPVGGVFRNASDVSVVGNQRLCGGIRELGLPLCEIQVKERNGRINRLRLVISLSVSCSILLIIIVLLVFLFYKRKYRRGRASIDMQLPEGFPIVSYAELSNATNGFSSSNLIGEGGFGSVYKGILGQDGMPVAVKVLNLLQKGASKSFIAECEALRNVRHRNLIKIVTVCSSIDFKGIDFKALVYEFMQNGSLEEWLHPSCEDRDGGLSLSFIQRLNISIEVASAIEYLHDHCRPHIVHGEIKPSDILHDIVHGDLKPSNILLDEDMVAHVGDFGLARFLTNSNPNESNSTGIKGAIGYVAPGYGMSRNASKAGDVYGFGILLLEMITGKRPTDSVFKDGFTLHQFVKRSLPERVVDVLEPSLLQEIQDAENLRARTRHGAVGIRETLVDVARVGVLCSMDSPNERMEMKQAVAELNFIRDKFLGKRR